MAGSGRTGFAQGRRYGMALHSRCSAAAADRGKSLGPDQLFSQSRRAWLKSRPGRAGGSIETGAFRGVGVVAGRRLGPPAQLPLGSAAADHGPRSEARRLLGRPGLAGRAAPDGALVRAPLQQLSSQVARSHSPANALLRSRPNLPAEIRSPPRRSLTAPCILQGTEQLRR